MSIVLRTGISIAGVIFLALVAVVLYNAQAPNALAEEAAVRADVEGFGIYLKSVPLLGPATSTAQTIHQSYAQFVTSELLAMWEADPKSAPGRLTSSPWPDHLEVSGITHQGNSYIVNGTVVLMTSSGPAGSVPFVAQVIKENDKWLIATYQEQSAT